MSLQLTHTLLDGENFESRRSLMLQTTRQLSPTLYARARYRFNDIEGFDDYSGLTGQRHEAGASLDWNRDAWDIGIEYRIEIGDYDDDSLSATRHLLRADIERMFGADWTVLFEVSRRHSDYDNDGSEDRSEVSLALTRTLSSRWDLVLRHTYTDNDADQAEFDYRGNRISLGVEAAL
ncbi:MAG: outer membrane beta-barrel protein [Steroidobacter sp.]|nr:outer membrane beta-barrel protein [Steroidobacter sp.]